jgi:hypothetical protein
MGRRFRSGQYLACVTVLYLIAGVLFNIKIEAGFIVWMIAILALIPHALAKLIYKETPKERARLAEEWRKALKEK